MKNSLLFFSFLLSGFLSAQTPVDKNRTTLLAHVQNLPKPVTIRSVGKHSTNGIGARITAKT
jgi:hypothetical protein